jgi:hypothetical protein
MTALRIASRGRARLVLLPTLLIYRGNDGGRTAPGFGNIRVESLTKYSC